MHSPRVLALLAGIAGLSAGPAAALRIDLNPVAGSAAGGVGHPGDRVELSIDVTLEPGDRAHSFFVQLQWDLAGGDVLDIVSASEASVQRIRSQWLMPINGLYRIGDPTQDSFGSLVPDGAAFPERFPGPTWVAGWEAVDLLGEVRGPATFSMGTAEFVLAGVGTTTVSILRGGRIGSWVFSDRGGDITDAVDFGSFDVTSVVGGAFAPASFVASASVPEPSTALLLGLCTAALAARPHLRQKRLR